MSGRLVARVMSTVAITIVFIAAGALACVQANNMQLLSVQSGSMTPAIKKGDLVAVNSVSNHDLAVGDVITFMSPKDKEVLITHRIVDIPTDDEVVITRGDANRNEDEPVPLRSIVGRVERSVPQAGRALDFIKQPIGLLTIIYVPAIIITVSELRRLAAYYRAKQPYQHPLIKFERRPVEPSTKEKAARLSHMVLALVVTATAVSMPVWAAMFDTVALSGNTISSAKQSTKSNHILIRELALRCSRFNSGEENFRPSIVLYNPTKETFELDGWKLESSKGVVAEFAAHDKLKRSRNLRIRPYLTDGLQHAGDYLVLKDAEGNVVDGISWGTDTTYLNPALPAVAESVRFYRKNRKEDSDSATDFRVRQYYHCAHPCFDFDPWEPDSETSIHDYIRSITEGSVSGSDA